MGWWVTAAPSARRLGCARCAERAGRSAEALPEGPGAPGEEGDEEQQREARHQEERHAAVLAVGVEEAHRRVAGVARGVRGLEAPRGRGWQRGQTCVPRCPTTRRTIVAPQRRQGWPSRP